MNAAGTTQSPADNGSYGNHSDDSSSDGESTEYYQPITTLDGEDSSEGEEEELTNRDLDLGYQCLPNGCLDSGVSSLDLSSENEEEEEEEVEGDGAIERAFTEDERRRRAPLPAENAVRVVEAMRRVEFPGPAPDWAVRVSDEQWVERLRGIRGTNS